MWIFKGKQATKKVLVQKVMFCSHCLQGCHPKKSPPAGFGWKARSGFLGQVAGEQDFSKSALKDWHPKNSARGIWPNSLLGIFGLNSRWAGFCQICFKRLAPQKFCPQHLTEKPAWDFRDKCSAGGILPTLIVYFFNSMLAIFPIPKSLLSCLNLPWQRARRELFYFKITLTPSSFHPSMQNVRTVWPVDPDAVKNQAAVYPVVLSVGHCCRGF